MDRIEFFLNRLYVGSRVPVSIYKRQSDETVKHICIPKENTDAVEWNRDDEAIARWMKQLEEIGKPFIYGSTETHFYGMFTDDAGTAVVWGPVQEDLRRLANVTASSYFFLTGRQMIEEEVEIHWVGEYHILQDAKGYEMYLLDKSEWKRIHNSIEYETVFLEAIERGDLEKLFELSKMPEPEGVGQVAWEEKKRMEYLCVASVTLCCRAAVRGGANPEEAYDLSDYFLQKLQQTKDMKDMKKLTFDMELTYAKLVRKQKSRQKKNLHVERCKDYIANHLRTNFKVHDIADELSINRTYLSKIFSQNEGMTIQQYILRERCEHASNMLRYTNYPISIIANYFCFSSQSHFTKKFQDVYGVTPKEYRKQNKYIESYQRQRQ